MRTVAAVAALLRRLRVEREAVVLLFVLVAVTSLLVAISPRLFQRVSDDGLQYELADSTVVQRNLQFSTVSQFTRVEARGQEIWERLPPSVQAIVDQRRFALETPRFVLLDPPNYATSVAFQYQDGIEEQVTFEAGRRPLAVTPRTDGAGVPRFEVAVSTATAEAILVGIGDVLRARVDASDPMLRRIWPRPVTEIDFEVVGLYRVDELEDPFWFGESRMARIAVTGTEEFPLALASAMFAPGAYPDFRELGLPMSYRWRYFVATDRIDDAYLETLTPDLRRLESTFGSTTGTPGDLTYRTGLLDIVDRYEALRATTQAAVSVAAIGPIGVAIGAVSLIALIIVGRRRTALVLVRGRGASARQVLAAQLWEGLLVTVPAALMGVVLAYLAVEARPDPSSTRGAVVVALATTALLLAAAWPWARRARRDLERDDPDVRRTTPRRLVVEATVVGVALSATWLLRERSIGGEGVLGFDPFLAAAPVLVGIAVGLMAIRVYPLPIHLLAAVTARRRDLVPVHGLRSIGRHPGAAYLPLLVMTLTIAIGVFSSVIETSIQRGQFAASWQEVGADFRIEAVPGSTLGSVADPVTVDGVEASAAALNLLVPPAFGSPGSATGVILHAIEPVDYEAVVADSPAAISLPPVIRQAPTDPAIGTPAMPIPALLSSRAPNGWPVRGVGDTLALQVKGQALEFVIVGFVESFPGLRLGSTFVVAPLESVFAAYDVAPIAPSMLFVRGPASVGPGLHGLLDATSGEETEISRQQQYDAVRAAPLVAAVGGGFLMALAIATAYAALAVVAVVALDARRRARELAFLRTLGLSERQLVGLTVVEHAPPVLVAVAMGVGLGLVVAWLLEPGLGLAVFIGPQAPVTLQVDWASVAAVIGAVIAVVIVAIGSSSWVARRSSPTDALRMGEG